jgi:hypothetical protein
MIKTSYAMLATVALLVFSSVAVRAQDSERRQYFSIGYKSLSIDDQRFVHDTHPDDAFLPDSQVLGSAGATDVSGRLHFVSIGSGYEENVTDRFLLTFDFGGLIGGTRDDRQNANDARPAATGASVYSEARWGMFAALGLHYDIKYFRVGVEAQVAGVFVDSGWDRFGDDERVHRKFETVPSAGPVIGYSFPGGYSRIEATVQIGHSIDYGVQSTWKF